MILNTGQRTDIPAFYADWFLRRVREGSVMVRNPFNYQRITSYRIDPEVVDVIAFCTKNPAPMLGKLGELAGYRQYWHVTITPYDKDIEPNVPPAGEVISSFRKLSGKVGKERTVCGFFRREGQYRGKRGDHDRGSRRTQPFDDGSSRKRQDHDGRKDTGYSAADDH